MVALTQEPYSESKYNTSTYVEDAVWMLAHAVNNCISTTGSVDKCSTNISRFIGDFSTDKACLEVLVQYNTLFIT